MSQLDLDRVTKRFGPFVAVGGISLSIPSGGVYGLLGPNGAGKTTTIRMILGFFYPDSGEIRLDGEPIDERQRRLLGYLPEERGLYRKMRVGEHLEYLGALRGLAPLEARQRTAEFLERLGLAAWSKKKVEELSKGMQQKVQFAATLLHDPKFVILDEPFSGLDPLNVELLTEWIAELRRRGVTIVFSTHQMETVEKLCESIALIYRGRVLVEGNLKEIKARYGRSKVRLELEADAEFDPAAAGALDARRENGGWEIQLPENDDGQRLLRLALERGPVARFERAAPSLQELFVRLVREAGELEQT